MWILGFYWAFLLLANRIIIRILNCINQRQLQCLLEKNLKKLLPNEKSLGEIQYIMVRRILFMEYKTYETDSAIDLERELNERQYEGWVLVNVVWNEDSDCYMATMKRR